MARPAAHEKSKRAHTGRARSRELSLAHLMFRVSVSWLGCPPGPLPIIEDIDRQAVIVVVHPHAHGSGTVALALARATQLRGNNRSSPHSA
jgi:hypothetical protein